MGRALEGHAADAVAKLVRPKLQCKDKEQLKRKRLEECCRSFEGLWKHMFTFKKAYVQAAGKLKPRLAPHTAVFYRSKVAKVDVQCVCHDLQEERKQWHCDLCERSQGMHRQMQSQGGGPFKPQHPHDKDGAWHAHNVLHDVWGRWLAEISASEVEM
jgi:hypothetical protein